MMKWTWLFVSAATVVGCGGTTCLEILKCDDSGASEAGIDSSMPIDREASADGPIAPDVYSDAEKVDALDGQSDTSDSRPGSEDATKEAATDATSKDAGVVDATADVMSDAAGDVGTDSLADADDGDADPGYLDITCEAPDGSPTVYRIYPDDAGRYHFSC